MDTFLNKYNFYLIENIIHPASGVSADWSKCFILEQNSQSEENDYMFFITQYLGSNKISRYLIYAGKHKKLYWQKVPLRESHFVLGMFGKTAVLKPLQKSTITKILLQYMLPTDMKRLQQQYKQSLEEHKSWMLL